jgi:type I restriction enzyme S subunit
MLANLLLPLPPLPEQRRIAAILDQADALRAKRREALVKLAEMAQAIFVEMFGDPTKNSLNLPTRPFGEICETRLGKMLDQKRQTGFHRRRYLRNANVRWFSFELSDLSEMDFNPGDRETYALRPGDLLICEGGEPGRAAVWSGEVKDCYYQKALHRARPKVGVAKSEFLAWFLWFASKGGGLKDHVTVATIAHLTKEKLDKLPVPLPDIREQEEFARRIAKLDVLRGTQNAAADQLNSLFTSLQHRAFSGTL